MANYAVNTTQSIGSTVFDPSLSVGDTITTSGYYALNDGGGATFEVKAGTADGVFSYNIGNHSGLIAEIVLENGVVNLDQLGAKGDAVLPAGYDDPVETIGACNTRTEATLTANSTATDNTPYFQSVMQHAGVREIRLTPGKIYGIAGTVTIPSNKKLDGSGATIMNLRDTQNALAGDSYAMLLCGQTGEQNITFSENIELCNFRLIGNVYLRTDPFDSVATVQGIQIGHVVGMRIHDLQIERCGHSIHVCIDDAALAGGSVNQVDIDGVQIKEALMGIQYNGVHNSHVRNCDISVDYTRFSDSNKLHCIYANKWIQNCTFEKLVLRNAQGGCGLVLRSTKENNASYTPPATQDIRVKDVRIDTVHKALGPDSNVKNIWISNVTATNVYETGMILRCAENVTLVNSSFSGFGQYGGIEIPNENTNTYAKKIWIRNCSFDFERSLFYISALHRGSTDSITLQNCAFRVSVLYTGWTTSVNPCTDDGVVANIRWIGCSFEMYESPDLMDDVGQERPHLEKNGLFFFLNGNSDPNLNQDWLFENCEFINRTNTSVNSPVCSNYANDHYGTVHCSMKDCVLEGFRWTIRIADRIDNNSVVSKTYEGNVTKYKVNPCFLGNNAVLKTNAADLLTETGRYYGKNNWLCTRNAGTGTRSGYETTEAFGM